MIGRLGAAVDMRVKAVAVPPCQIQNIQHDAQTRRMGAVQSNDRDTLHGLSNSPANFDRFDRRFGKGRMKQSRYNKRRATPAITEETAMTMTIALPKVTPIAPFGCEITGVDFSADLPPE